MAEALTLRGLVEATSDLVEAGQGQVVLDWPLVVHSPGGQSWLDVARVSLDTERERIVLHLRGRT